MTVIGFDPSSTSYGISDGRRHARFRTAPADGSLRERALKIFDAIEAWIAKGHETSGRGRETFVFVVEGAAYGGGGASAQFDAGYLRAVFDALAESWDAIVYEVNPSTLKKFGAGKGNTAKSDMKQIVFERFGVKFEDDPGADKLHAYLLHRYGVAVTEGRVAHSPTKTRGRGVAARAAARKAARTKNTVAA